LEHQTTPAVPELLADSFREGMLAVIGHDLRLTAERFEVRVQAGAVTARIALTSLRVIGSMVKGRLEQGSPSIGDRAEIEQRLQGEILATARHPEATLNATVQAEGTAWTLAGTLSLCGHTEPVRMRAMRAGDVLEASVELKPSRYGIAPFRALGGALRVADRVVVRVRLPVTAALPGSDLAALTACWQRGSW
jgi:hypothetical protein